MDDRGGGVVDRVAGSVGIFYYVGKQHVTYLQPVTTIYPRESTKCPIFAVFVSDHQSPRSGKRNST